MEDTRISSRELENMVSTRPQQEVFEYMRENLILFFATPDIPVYYKILRVIDFSTSESLTPRLMMAWMAFLCGDNPSLFSIISSICETRLCGPEESSLFYTLKAMIKYMNNPEEGLYYGKLSLDILSKEEESFYIANAKLTYGQLLAGSKQYRLAADMFESSYSIFYSKGLYFLSVVALVNEALNLYSLGEFSRVINICDEALMMSGSFRGETQGYWGLAHLPLGMCYYEMNKPNLSIEHLKLAKKSIDKFELFHMHGFVEMFLYKSYYILNDSAEMEKIRDEAVTNFGHMHYKKTDLIISMFKIFLLEQSGINRVQPDIEKLELEYARDGINSSSMVINSLMFLKLLDISSTIGIEYLIQRLERLKYLGSIPEIQITYLEIAELYYLENNQSEALSYLREAVGIYKEYGISASFSALPFKSTGLLQAIDMCLYSCLKKDKPNMSGSQKSTILSSREGEIMRLIALGKTNEEISKTLYISVGTIKWHINHIFSKLEARNRVEAIEKAKTLGEI